MPAKYSLSIFFKEDELEVYTKTSLYTIVKQLEERIADDYRVLVLRVFAQHPDLFPLAKFIIQIPRRRYHERMNIVANQSPKLISLI